MKMTVIQPLMVFLLFKGCLAACTLEPTHIWPLGGGIANTEIKSNSVSGTLGSVLYGTGLAAVGNYSVMEFSGTRDSFVDVNVPFTASAVFDFSFMFYVKLNNVSSSSTMLHFRSNDFQAGSTSAIREFVISISGGNISMNFTNFGAVTWNTSSLIFSGQWLHVTFSRDISRAGSKIFLNGVNMGDLFINSLILLKNMSLPGVLRLGGNIDGSNSLSGAITCLQFVPCKDAIDPTFYSPKCNQINWPLISPAQDSVPISTEQTKITDASATTSVALMTTTAAPTTSSNTPTTTSDALTSATSTTATSAQTTTTSAQTTTTSAQTTTTSAQTTITSAQTATFMVQTTAISNSFAVINSCHHYKLIGNDVTFGNNLDIVDVLIVSDTSKCAVECDRNAECNMFAVVSLGINIECKLGVKTSTLINLTGSKFFEK